MGNISIAQLSKPSWAPSNCKGFKRLLEESEAEGFRFPLRLQQDWQDGTNVFDKPGEALWAALSGNYMVGLGGMNRISQTVGRLRRFYILPEVRRHGFGRSLLLHVLSGSNLNFEIIELRTDNPVASAFYTSCGFAMVNEDADVTHRLVIEAAGSSELT